MTFAKEPEALDAHLRFDGVICLGSFIADYYDNLTTAEQQVVAGAVEKRRREYATGRWLARCALTRLGINQFDLLPGCGRQPVWPDNIVGSITHSNKYAATAASLSSNYCAVGIDIERSGRLENSLLPKILLPDEKQRYLDIDATLIFSAKESCYKLLYPLIGQFIGFHDIEVYLDDIQKTFTVGYRGNHKANAIVEQAEGQYFMLNDHWLTCITLKAGL